MSARRRVALEIRSLDEIPEGMDIAPFFRDRIGRGATYCVIERQALGFEAWLPRILERCPLDRSWGAGFEDDPDEQSEMHALFAGWIWDEINDELPEGTVVVDLRYAGSARCDSAVCPATDCTLMWDVIDAAGLARRVDVPI